MATVNIGHEKLQNPITKKCKATIKTMVNERVMHVEQYIYKAIYLHANTRKLYFTDIVNALMELIQQPVLIAIYRAPTNERKLTLIYCSTNDQHRAEEIFKQVNNTDYSPRTHAHINAKMKDGHSYYVKAIRIKSSKNEKIPKVVSLADKDPCSYYTALCLKVLLERPNKLWGHYISQGNSAIFWNTLYESIQEYSIGNKTNGNKGNDNCLGYTFELKEKLAQKAETKWLRELLPNRLKSAFETISNTADFMTKIITPANQYHCPNYFVFYRFYEPKLKRYKDKKNTSYNYHCAMLIGEEQEESIIELLEYLRIIGRQKTCQIIMPYSEFALNSGLPENQKTIITDLDNWFWSKIEAKLYDHIVDALATPTSQFAQSFADVVFNSSVTCIREVYSNSGLYRIEHESLETAQSLSEINEEIIDDLHRTVCTHYILSSMAPKRDEENDDLHMVLSPIEVGGTTLMVTGHMMYAANSETRDDRDWFIKSNFISTIRHKFESSVKRKIRYLHVDQLNEAFVTALKNSQQKIKQEGCDTYTALYQECEKAIFEHGIASFSPYSIPYFDDSGKELLLKYANDDKEPSEYFGDFCDTLFEYQVPFKTRIGYSPQSRMKTAIYTAFTEVSYEEALIASAEEELKSTKEENKDNLIS